MTEEDEKKELAIELERQRGLRHTEEVRKGAYAKGYEHALDHLMPDLYRFLGDAMGNDASFKPSYKEFGDWLKQIFHSHNLKR